MHIIIIIIIIIPAGVVAVLYWGGSVTNPSTDQLSGALSASANAILLYCTFLDFAIMGSVVNRELQRFWMPHFNRECSWRNLPTWLLITLPSLIFALVLSVVMPGLSSLTGLLNSLCIPSTLLLNLVTPAALGHDMRITASPVLTVSLIIV